MTRQLTLCVLLVGVTLPAQAEWPRFRGLDGNGAVADDERLPHQWNDVDQVAWMADVPGYGWSSPIVVGSSVFLTTVVSDNPDGEKPKAGLYLGRGVRTPPEGIHRWRVYSLDLKSGKELWQRDVHVGEPTVPRHPKSTYASETPVTDGKRLYVLFGDLGLYCFDLAGKPLWNRPIAAKKTFFDYGAAASPVIHEGQVFVVYDNLEESWIASFDAESGEERWRVPREETHSWATPLVWKNPLRTEIVVPGKTRNRSYDLSGKLLWEFDGRMSNLVIPSPFVANGLLYIASGYIGDPHRPVYAIKPGAEGDITQEEDPAASEFVEWYQPKASPYNTSPIVYRGRFYTLYDRGFLTCHDAATGEEIYEKQRFTPRASFTASPWAYNGKIFCLSEGGDTYVISAGDDFEVEVINPLDELCLSTPSMSQGRLLIRTASKLYCLTHAK